MPEYREDRERAAVEQATVLAACQNGDVEALQGFAARGELQQYLTDPTTAEAWAALPDLVSAAVGGDADAALMKALAELQASLA